MKKALCLIIAAVIAAAAYMAWVRYVSERSIVIISTTDVHAKVENFPRLATAIARCRDTVATIVADAGDRWTGNAYVDMAREPRRPVIDMMNAMGYDVATLGNHEFDDGQAFLGHINSLCRFDVVCANVVSDTITFPQPAPYRIFCRRGVKVGFVGVVTNYDHNNHPAGKDESFEGLVFPDPQRTAAEYAWLKDRCDVLVLLSHMGDDMDRELASKCSAYDLILCGHTHNLVDTVVNGTALGQSGYGAKNIGVTHIRMKGTKIASLDYRIVPITEFAPDTLYERWVADLHDNEALSRPVGESSRILTRVGLAAWETDAMRRRFDADVAFYHYGGIRFDSLPGLPINTGMIYGMEPFSSTLYTMRMTPAQMRRMIISKYNDTANPKESHRIDLFSSTPYTIRVDGRGEAVDVIFPDLEEADTCRVVMGDYMYKNYRDIEATDVVDEGVLLTDVLINHLRENSPIDYSNEGLQNIRRVE